LPQRIATWHRSMKSKRAIESFIGSAGILIVGFASIPVAADLVGASLSMPQGAGMGAIFFLARWCWLYIVRTIFDRI